MANKCAACSVDFSITGAELALLNKITFSFGNKSFPFPASPYCPECRQQQRLLFRNERQLYHNYTADDRKKHISLYHPTPLWGEQYQLLEETKWHGAPVDPLSFGREFDFSRSFFEQYAELHKSVPRMSIVNLVNENSPYTSHTGYSKNCYLIPCSEYCENCYYGRFLQNCTDCVDCTSLHKCELCYECFTLKNCYHCIFLSLSQGCSDCYFSDNLVGCNSCIFSTNLQRQDYAIFNKPVSKVEFEENKREIFSSPEAFAKAQETWKQIRESRVSKPLNITSSENSFGDFISNSKNCQGCYDITECEDCLNLSVGIDDKDCLDCSNVYLKTELSYQILGTAGAYHCAFCQYVFTSSNLLYCEYVYDSKNLFACVGLKRAEYCILNKQYSEDDYEIRAQKIIEHMKKTGEWGKMFPPTLSPFGYNETVAADFYPLSREEVIAKGWLWRDLEKKEQPTITKETPPKDVTDFNDTVCKDVYRCKATGDAYKIMAQELNFLLKEGIPLPQYSPQYRHKRRESVRNPHVFRRASCEQCALEIVTNISSGNNKIFCEKCFQEQIF